MFIIFTLKILTFTKGQININLFIKWVASYFDKRVELMGQRITAGGGR